MTIKFVDRKKELEGFRKLGKVNVIFGRRRIGKTRFVKELLKGKNSIYFLAINKEPWINLKRFSEQCSNYFSITGIRFESFKEMFEFLNRRKEIEIIAIDEFGYLVKHNLLPEFQEIIDEILNKKLIITGSSISLMESSFLKLKSPLYGRVDKILHLQPLKFKYLFEWFDNISLEDAVKIYAVTNGVPRYLEFFNGKNVEKEIMENFFSQSFLFYDARKLLEEELVESERYFFILEAVARGKNTLNEIKNYTKIEYQSLPFYLQKLKRLKIINSLYPVIGRRKGIYEIGDNYFTFWFGFVYPYEDEIDSLYNENAVYNFRRNFSSYLGHVFEKICNEIFVELIKNRTSWRFTKIGRWWHKGKEIDIVGLNDTDKSIIFSECKWQDKVDAEKICKELAEKAKYVEWHNKVRKERFAIFAKSFSKK